MREETVFFKRLERCFWALWALAPFLLSLAIHYTWTSPYAILDDSDASKAIVSTFSFSGQLLVSVEMLIHVGFYVMLVALMHMLVRRFARGQMLMSATLGTMKSIAWLLLAYAFIEMPLYNLNMYLLHRFGDLPSWEPVYFLDVMTLALALTLFALRILIRHAIGLQKDVDLTV
jgi:uncharacterized membrane protein YagU involved in acid resistance